MAYPVKRLVLPGARDSPETGPADGYRYFLQLLKVPECADIPAADDHRPRYGRLSPARFPGLPFQGFAVVAMLADQFPNLLGRKPVLLGEIAHLIVLIG